MSSSNYIAAEATYLLENQVENDDSLKKSTEITERNGFCEKICAQNCLVWCFGTSLWLAFTFMALYRISKDIALVLAAIAPGLLIMYVAKVTYPNDVLVGQMILSFFEAVAWMVPLLFVDYLGLRVIHELIKLDSDRHQHLNAYHILIILCSSLFFAGFCEEMVKYITISRLQNSRLVSSYRSLLVYGICAGAGFATCENLSYVLSDSTGGVGTAIARAFTSVPLHCLTSSIIGMSIATQRYLGPDVKPFWQSKCLSYIVHNYIYYFYRLIFLFTLLKLVIFVPWLIHSGFDTCLMLGQNNRALTQNIAVLASYCIYTSGLIYARLQYLELEYIFQSPTKSIQDLLVNSEVSFFFMCYFRF
jgi:RsiW-degrading membrane proteinase PrsW (M82 family)